MNNQHEFSGNIPHKKRVMWTEELDEMFAIALHRLGRDAVPRAILRELADMGVRGLSRENVASHLQKFRQKKLKELRAQLRKDSFFSKLESHNLAFQQQQSASTPSQAPPMMLPILPPTISAHKKLAIGPSSSSPALLSQQPVSRQQSLQSLQQCTSSGVQMSPSILPLSNSTSSEVLDLLAQSALPPSADLIDGLDLAAAPGTPYVTFELLANTVPSHLTMFPSTLDTYHRDATPMSPAPGEHQLLMAPSNPVTGAPAAMPFRGF
eukprot:comp10296_c0_seq1/m.12403 comp10296_c0_seq1/g.12403  ORF comp10296_c0_seq1/g.12403 comp10296_c0_seq1/m.12403 type:complete len:266 (-) comp10296_c0_seq1:348-1145(-)